MHIARILSTFYLPFVNCKLCKLRTTAIVRLATQPPCLFPQLAGGMNAIAQSIVMASRPLYPNERTRDIRKTVWPWDKSISLHSSPSFSPMQPNMPSTRPHSLHSRRRTNVLTLCMLQMSRTHKINVDGLWRIVRYCYICFTMVFRLNHLCITSGPRRR
jgi:hypothetical protein